MKNGFLRAMSLTTAVLVAYAGVSNLSFKKADASNKAEVRVEESSNSITIGNDFMSREFSIEDAKIKTKTITNKRIDGGVTFTPGNASENFTIKTIVENDSDVEIVNPTKKLSTGGWTAKASNGQDASAVLDGNPQTKWEANSKPYELVFDLQEPKTFSSFSYQARQDGFKNEGGIWGINGIFKGYEVHISEDGQTWNKVKNGDLDVKLYNNEEANEYNRSEPVYVNFNDEITTQHIKLVCTSQLNGADFAATASEFALYEDRVLGEEEETNTEIKASDLELEENGIRQEKLENGVKVTFDFKSYKSNDVDWDIDYVVVMNNGDHFMRSFMEITVPEDQQEKARIDYIDTDDFKITETALESSWSRPDDMTSMWIRPYELSLGQPIYLEGMFFGSEFPATDTDIDGEDLKIRYYSGKSFAELEKTTEGKFVTWQNVVGSARSKDHSVVQADLFSYIDTIATRTDFRKQYNSWYDHMMDINEQNIQDSFYEIEKGLTQSGVGPLDSYVVDDGWNAYEGMRNGAPSGGPFDNKTGFWEFNEKFPNELYPAKSLSSRMDSKFGLWLGPRGGYNYNDGFGQYLEHMGTGNYNPNGFMNDVCVGSDVYQENLLNLFLDYQERFDLNYWKLDGFALRPCKGTDHGHMTGGNNDMYFTTELWENWGDMFDQMRQQRVDLGKDLWINLTCYANPSPWFLQWVNTVWLQDCGDNGFIDTIQGGENKGVKLNGSDADQALTYRDDIYDNIFDRKGLQFPLKNVYNHDPIYGNTASNFLTGKRVEMTEEEFRQYMYGNAVRGTAFWELYFSYNMMNEGKWMITSEVLDWAESNFAQLEKAQQIGGTPGNGEVYGYSGWNKDGGIISMRNPRDVEQTFEVRLDNLVGVPEDMKNLVRKQILPYAADAKDGKTWNYGDTISVTLQPHELLIYQFGEEDTVAPAVEFAQNTTNNALRIKFNEAIAIDANSFTVDGEVVEGRLLDDYKTVEFDMENVLPNGTKIGVNVKDISGNILETTVSAEVFADQTVATVDTNADLKDGNDIVQLPFDKAELNMLKIQNKGYELNTSDSLAGTDDFSTSMVIRTDSTNTTLLEQDGAFKLALDKDGFVEFTVNGVTVKSDLTETIKNEEGNFVDIQKGKVNDGTIRLINAVREANGMLKLYIDGELMASKYDENVKKFDAKNSKITLADENFDGLVADAKVYNRALAFDDAKGLYETLNLNPTKEISRENWTATANSEHPGTNEGPAQNAIDGNLGTWWHTSYSGQIVPAPHHITIDMGEETLFNRFEYVSRNGNGDIKDYDLEVSNDGETWTSVSSGTWQRGGSSTVEFDNVTARYIKLNANATYGTPENTFASAAELKAYLYEGPASSYTNLFETIKVAKTFTQDGYTQESFANLTLRLNEALAIRDNLNATQEAINTATDNLTKAIDGLVVANIKVDKVKNFKAEATKDSISLSWEKPDYSAGLVEYIIYKDGKEFTRIDANTLEASVTGLKANTLYGFKIEAVYSNNKKSKAVSVNARTLK
ncbi:MAG: discoidin domain-containing protein [Sarcina sp.]